MRTLAQALYQDSMSGVDYELPSAGSALENPLVFDAAAREFKTMAERGLVEIVYECQADTVWGALINKLRFKRLH
jgi:hypothetical protein